MEKCYEKAKKFSGSPWDDLPHLRDARKLKCDANGISEQTARDKMRIMLEEEALGRYMTQVKEKDWNLDKLFDKMCKRFYAKSAIQDMQNELESLHFNQFKTGDKTDKQALDDLRKKAKKLFR